MHSAGTGRFLWGGINDVFFDLRFDTCEVRGAVAGSARKTLEAPAAEAHRTVEAQTFIQGLPSAYAAESLLLRTSVIAVIKIIDASRVFQSTDVSC